MKTAKITLELNAIELNALLSSIESKWDGTGAYEKRNLPALARAVDLAPDCFNLDDQQFAFETVNTAALYRRLFGLLEHFPEIADASISATWTADSEAQFRRALARARKQVADIPLPLRAPELAGTDSEPAGGNVLQFPALTEVES